MQKHAREDRDQDRPDVHEHRRGSGVDPLLSGVERDVVQAEPEDAADRDARQLAAAGHRRAAHEDEDPEGGAPHEEPPERERSRRELAVGEPDRDERRRPQADHHRDRADHEHAVPRRARDGRGDRGHVR